MSISVPGRSRRAAAGVAAALFLLGVCAAASGAVGRSAIPPGSVVNGARDSYLRLPMGFELNRGQAGAPVRFLARGRGYTLHLTETQAALALYPSKRTTREASGRRADPGAATPRASVVRMTLVGGRKTARMTGERKLPGTVSYFRGRDSARWHSQIPTFAEVRYRGVYPGVDLVYYGDQRRLEYDFVVAPGADPNQIRLELAGASRYRLDRNGDLVLSTPDGELRQGRPVAYQVIEGRKVPVSASYGAVETMEAPIGSGPGKDLVRRVARVGFHLGRHDPERPLVIDPTLDYSTFLGGAGDEEGRGIAVDAAGSAYVVGYEYRSPDFPTTAGAFDVTPDANLADVFVSKLAADGSSLVYSTVLGGSGSDHGFAIALDRSGGAVVTGSTDSEDFPTTDGYDSTYSGNTDVFVAKLTADGSALAFSTYLGGTNFDVGNGVAVDSAGSPHVVGQTLSVDFPATLGAFQTTNNGTSNAFVTKLDPFGASLFYSTYLGGAGQDFGQAIAVDADDRAVVTGFTFNSLFPTTPGAFSSVNSGARDVFVAKLTFDAADLVFSTLLGGEDGDEAAGVAVAPDGTATVTGLTRSEAFPTTAGAYDETPNGNIDAFVTRVAADGTALVYSTYLGGDQGEAARGIAICSDGGAVVTGHTSSRSFPTTNDALDTTYNTGSYNAFVTKLAADGSRLVYSTFLGGNSLGTAIAADASIHVFVTGYSTGPDGAFPVTPGAFDTTFNQSTDVFVSKLGLLRRPSAPKGLTASAKSSRRIDLKWKDNSTTEAGYDVYRRRGSGGFRRIARLPADTAGYTDTPLGGKRDFLYRVRAHNPGGASPYSNVAGAVTPPLQVLGPSAGGQLSVSALALSFGTVGLQQTLQRTIQLANRSKSTELIVVVNEVAAPYGVGGTATYKLKPGARRDVDVTFQPTAAGQVKGSLVIAASDTRRLQVKVALTGTGR
jgi:hypothetical protein